MNKNKVLALIKSKIEETKDTIDEPFYCGRYEHELWRETKNAEINLLEELYDDVSELKEEKDMLKELTIQDAIQAFAHGKKVKCIVPREYASESCCQWDEGNATYTFNDVYDNGEISYNGNMPLTQEMILYGRFYLITE